MGMGKLRCTVCGEEYGLEELYQCPKDHGELTFIYDYKALGSDSGFRGRFRGGSSMWDRYFEILPLADKGSVVSMGEGGTPLVRASRLAKALGIPNLYLKLECCNPTGSFKDRQISVAISNGTYWGRREYATVSSGNVGNALASYCAKQGYAANVWVPEDTPVTKYQQIQIYGCKLFLYPADSEHQTHFFEGLSGFCQEHGMVPMISARPVNPYMVEGSKTISFEIFSQLGKLPDCVAAPIGGGGLYGGLWKGFSELRELGFTNRLPVQCGSQRIGNTIPVPELENPDFNRTGYSTPLDGLWAKEAMQSCGGLYTAVTEADVAEAQKLLATLEGVFAEPHGALACAGMIQAARAGRMKAYDTVVCIVTGTGLKDAQAMCGLLEDNRLFAPLSRVETLADSAPHCQRML